MVDMLHSFHKWSMLGIIVEPPNKGHFGNNINSVVFVLCREVDFFWGVKSTETIGSKHLGTSSGVLCREDLSLCSLG